MGFVQICCRACFDEGYEISEIWLELKTGGRKVKVEELGAWKT